MQFSNVDDSLVKQKIPCNKVYSYEALAFYFPDLLIFLREFSEAIALLTHDD